MDLITETQRTTIHRVNKRDAEFFRDLLNSPGWIRYIGNRNVPDTAAAEEYIQSRMIRTYEEHGFGYYTVRLRNGTRIGTCGFLKKPHLENPDFGFAFLPAHQGQGYARESASAILEYGIETFDFRTLDAETLPENQPSIRLLKALSFQELDPAANSTSENDTVMFRWQATD